MATDFFSEARERIGGERALVESRAHFVKAAPEGAGIGGATGGAGALGLGFRQDARAREAYAQFKNWVYVSVNALAKRVARQAVCAGELVGASPNPDRHVPPHRKNTIATFLKAAVQNQTVEIFDDHLVLDVLHEPNRVQGKFEFMYSSVVNLLITGEAYWIAGLVRDGEENEPRLELWSVPTNWVVPKHKDGLFSSFDIKIDGKKIAEDLPPEAVARTYYPHPTSMQMAWSPLLAMSTASQIDSHILSTQLQLFERGIFPNVVVSVGKVRGPDGKQSDRRPILRGHQRRQIIASIRELWNQTANAGEPAIVDGLIESVHKLSNNAQEMDFIGSGRPVKERIMQAYQVNEIFTGQIVGANRAQAVEAEKSVLGNAVNPLLDSFSETATRFLGPMFEEPARLVVWFEQAEATDPDLHLKRWGEARKNDDVTGDEYRANVLGLPPDEREPRGHLLKQISGFQAFTQIMQAVGNGSIDREVAARAFVLFFEIEESVAEELAGMDLHDDDEEDPAAPPAIGQDPPANDSGETDDDLDEETEEDLEELAASVAALEKRLDDASETLHEHVVRVGQTMLASLETLLKEHEKTVARAVENGRSETDGTGTRTGEGEASDSVAG